MQTNENRLSLVQRAWRPQELSAPVPPHKMEEMGAVERTATVVVYSIRRLEYWLSPRGRLREWCRFNVGIFAVLLIPTVTVVPVVLLLCGQLAAWTGYLVMIARNLLALCLALLLTGLTVAAIITFLRNWRVK